MKNAYWRRPVAVLFSHHVLRNCRYANDEENKDEEKNNSQVTMIAHTILPTFVVRA